MKETTNASNPLHLPNGSSKPSTAVKIQAAANPAINMMLIFIFYCLNTALSIWKA